MRLVPEHEPRDAYTSFALLRLRRDSYIFQDKHVQNIVAELFADYPQLHFEFDLTQDLAVRPICTQYRESDYDFFVRLMVSEGLAWRFEHDQAMDAADGQARHRLMIFDSRAAAPETPGNPVLRFHGVRATDTDHAIDPQRVFCFVRKTSYSRHPHRENWRQWERKRHADRCLRSTPSL